MRRDRRRAWNGRDAPPPRIGIELPCIDRIGEQRGPDLVDARLQGRVFHRGEHLDAPVEIPREKVRASDHESSAFARLEPEDPAVLEKRPEHAANRDPVGRARRTGAEGADAAHHKLDTHAGAGRGAERLDDGRVRHRVDLDRDPAGEPSARSVRDLRDLVEQPVLQIPRSDHELLEPGNAAAAGQCVEQRLCVGRDHGVGCEEAQVLVHGGV